VRELENLVRRLVVLKDPATVLGELTSLPAPLASLDASRPDDVPLKEVGRRAAQIAEREAILHALTRTGWNKRKAATRLQISYKAVLYKIKDCEIVDPRDSGRADR
jgi:two-component system response regulator AtoC